MTSLRAILYAFMIVAGTALIIGGVATHAQNNPPTAYVLEYGHFGWYGFVSGIASKEACERLYETLNSVGMREPHRCISYEVTK